MFISRQSKLRDAADHGLSFEISEEVFEIC